MSQGAYVLTTVRLRSRAAPLPTGPERACHGRARGGVSADGVRLGRSTRETLHAPPLRTHILRVFLRRVRSACGLRRTLAYFRRGSGVSIYLSISLSLSIYLSIFIFIPTGRRFLAQCLCDHIVHNGRCPVCHDCRLAGDGNDSFDDDLDLSWGLTPNVMMGGRAAGAHRCTAAATQVPG